MKYIRSPKLFFIGLFVMVLLVNVITAYFSVGYYHTDEHVHILGFMNYKLGQNPQNNLPLIEQNAPTSEVGDECELNKTSLL